MSKELSFIIGAMSLLGVGLFVIERRVLSTRELAIYGLLAAIGAALRIPCSAIPSVQPTTFVVMVTGYVFGILPGGLVGLSVAVISNCYLGHGPWTVLQALSWGFCGVLAGLLGSVSSGTQLNRRDMHKLAVLGGFCGWLFGAIMNLWYWYCYSWELTFASFAAVSLASMWFDVAHAVANIGLVYVVGPTVVGQLVFYREHFVLKGGCVNGDASL